MENGSRHKQLARDIPGSYSKLVYLIGFLINEIIVGFLINGIMIFLTISTLSWWKVFLAYQSRSKETIGTSQYVSFRLPIPIVFLQGMFSQDMGCTLLLTEKKHFFTNLKRKWRKYRTWGTWIVYFLALKFQLEWSFAVTIKTCTKILFWQWIFCFWRSTHELGQIKRKFN